MTPTVVPGQSTDAWQATRELLQPVLAQRLADAGHAPIASRLAAGFFDAGPWTLDLTDGAYERMHKAIAHSAASLNRDSDPRAQGALVGARVAAAAQQRLPGRSVTTGQTHQLEADLRKYGVDIHIEALRRLSAQVSGRGTGHELALHGQREILQDVYAGELSSSGFSARTAEAAASRFLASRTPADLTRDPVYCQNMRELHELAGRMQPAVGGAGEGEWARREREAFPTSDAGIRRGLQYAPAVHAANVVAVAASVRPNAEVFTTPDLREAIAAYQGAFAGRAGAVPAAAGADRRPPPASPHVFTSARDAYSR